MKFVWFFKLIGGEILKILIWALKLLVWVRVIPNVVRIPQYLVFNFTHVSWLALDDSTHPTPVKTSRPTWPGVEASRRRGVECAECSRKFLRVKKPSPAAPEPDYREPQSGTFGHNRTQTPDTRNRAEDEVVSKRKNQLEFSKSLVES